MDLPNPYEVATPDDKKRWIVIYPAYINAKKTQAEGRRIPKLKAIDVPQVTEIRDVLVSQGFMAEIEAKQYPREHARDNLHSGRVRVQLKNSEGDPVNPEVCSRQDVLLLACELIPKLKSRQSRGAEGGDGGSQGGQGGGNKKKKGKRK